jgi:hypothetical protein
MGIAKSLGLVGVIGLAYMWGVDDGERGTSFFDDSLGSRSYYDSFGVPLIREGHYTAPSSVIREYIPILIEKPIYVPVLVEPKQEIFDLLYKGGIVSPKESPKSPKNEVTEL